MILVDSNVPMYLVGAEHPRKLDAQRLLERCAGRGERLVTDAEVLQEILHRYVAIGRPEAIQPAFDALLGIVDEVFPITQLEVQRAKEVILGTQQISARDAIHVAVMKCHGIRSILSFDRDFDLIPGVDRIS